jgi:hypothetical protein
MSWRECHGDEDIIAAELAELREQKYWEDADNFEEDEE